MTAVCPQPFISNPKAPQDTQLQFGRTGCVLCRCAVGGGHAVPSSRGGAESLDSHHTDAAAADACQHILFRVCARPLWCSSPCVQLLRCFPKTERTSLQEMGWKCAPRWSSLLQDPRHPMARCNAAQPGVCVHPAGDQFTSPAKYIVPFFPLMLWCAKMLHGTGLQSSNCRWRSVEKRTAGCRCRLHATAQATHLTWNAASRTVWCCHAAISQVHLQPHLPHVQ